MWSQSTLYAAQGLFDEERDVGGERLFDDQHMLLPGHAEYLRCRSISPMLEARTSGVDQLDGDRQWGQVPLLCQSRPKRPHGVFLVLFA